MTYTKAHLLFRILGHYGSGTTDKIDEWSCSFRVDINATGSVGEAAKLAFLTSMDAAVNNFHTDTTVKAGASCWYDALSAAYVGTDGKYLSGPGGVQQDTTLFTKATPVAGTPAASQPWDVARAYTLITTLGRGRASKGRFYYPVNSPIDSTGRWTAVECQGAAHQAQILIDSINDNADLQWPGSTGVSVFSKMGSGTTAPVIEVGVGRAPDTQRRRTKNLVENYQTEAIPTAAVARQRRDATEFDWPG